MFINTISEGSSATACVDEIDPCDKRITLRKPICFVVIGFLFACLSLISFGFIPLGLIFTLIGIRSFYLTVRDLEKVIGLYSRKMTELKTVVYDDKKLTANFFRQTMNVASDESKDDVETCAFSAYDEKAQRIVRCDKVLDPATMHTVTDNHVGFGDTASQEFQDMSENSIMVAHFCEKHCPKGCTKGCER